MPRSVHGLLIPTDQGAPSGPVPKARRSPPTTVTRDERLSQCLKLMSAGDFRHLPVVDGQGMPTHLLAVRHLMQYLAERYPSEVLAMAPNVFQITEVDGG